MIRYTQPNLNLNINQEDKSKHRFHLKRPRLNKVVKFNNLSPLYMFELSEENRNYALSLKKSAAKLNFLLDQGSDDGDSSVFHLKKANSGNKKIAQVDIINTDYNELPEPFTLKVKSLAISQINSGYEVPSNNKSFPIGIYSFCINIEDNSYEFQLDVPKKCTNKEIIIRVINMINHSQAGIMASFVENHKKDTIQAVLKAEHSGAMNQLAFTLQDISDESVSREIIEYFGLNNVLQYPKNCTFEINGIEKESTSNCFTYNKIIKITLNAPSDEEISVTYIPDGDKIAENFAFIIDEYNNLMDLINMQGESQKASASLKNDLSRICKEYENELGTCGLIPDEAGKLKMDHSLVLIAAREGFIKDFLRKEEGYISAIRCKMDQIMSDPMMYLDKKVVTYPNTSNPVYYNPYILSLYSGMIYNFYC